MSDIAFTCTPANTKVNVNVSKDSFKALNGLTLTLQDASHAVVDTLSGISIGVNPSTQASFTQPVNAGSYSVVITQQPSTGQTCTPVSGRVTISNAGANVAIECTTPAYTVSSSVSGLTTAATKLALKLESPSGTEFLPVTANGTAAFTSPLFNGNRYNVSVFQQPTGQSCSVTNNYDVISNSSVTNVSVICAPITTMPTYRVSSVVTVFVH